MRTEKQIELVGVRPDVKRWLDIQAVTERRSRVDYLDDILRPLMEGKPCAKKPAKPSART